MTTLPLGHCRLTVSTASTDVALIILRAVDLAAASLDGHFDHSARSRRVLSDSALSKCLKAPQLFSTLC